MRTLWSLAGRRRRDPSLGRSKRPAARSPLGRLPLLAGLVMIASAMSPGPSLPVSAATTVACPNGAKTWDGASGNWSVAANWSGDTVPAAGDDACILDPNVTVTLDASPLLDQFVSDGAVTIPGSRTLTIQGDSEVSGALTLAGTAAGAGTLSVSGNAEWSSGTVSADLVVVPSGTLDTINGGAGTDGLSGGDCADEIHGGSGNDRMSGQAGADEMFGEGDNDVLSGGNGGTDELHGGAAGGGRRNTLYGGRGNDCASGGPDRIPDRDIERIPVPPGNNTDDVPCA